VHFDRSFGTEMSACLLSVCLVVVVKKSFCKVQVVMLAMVFVLS